MQNVMLSRLRNMVVLGSVTSSVLLSAIVLEIVPDHRGIVLKGRRRLHESLVVRSSAFITRDDTHGLQGLLLSVVEDEDDLLSVGVRRADGTLLMEAGEHAIHWQKIADGSAKESQIRGSLSGDRDRVHFIEARFTPLGGLEFAEIANGLWIPLIVFVTVVSMTCWYLYSGTQLNGLQPVPDGLHSVSDCLPGGLLLLDHHGRVVLCNQSLARMLGRDQSSAVASDTSEYSWLQDDLLQSESVEYPWKRILEGGRTVHSGVFPLRDTSGQQKKFRITAAPWVSRTAEVRGACCSFEEAVEPGSPAMEFQAVAEAAAETRARFLADMNHEMRTPINAVLGFTEVLRDGLIKDKRQQIECIDEIRSNAQHLFRLIQEMMDILKSETGHLEVSAARCSPHQMLLEVMELLRVQAQNKNLRLECVTPDGLPEVIQTDRLRLRQMITRLAANAIQCTNEGAVTVCARIAGGATPLLRIDVRDDGVGISAAAQQKMFGSGTPVDDPFIRTFGGADPVLMMYRQLAEALGGSLFVQSEAGSGSTFTITVEPGPVNPAAAMIDIRDFIPSAPDMTATAAGETPCQGKNLRVLNVDDGDSNRELIRLVLQRKNLTVEMAADGREAVDMALSSEYDVVLMDMNMPGMDGYTATGLLRSYGLQMPIIALTASTMCGSEEKCLDAGCSHFLAKPVEIDKLLELLATLSGGSEPSAVDRAMPDAGQAAKTSVSIVSQPAASPTSGFTNASASSGESDRSAVCVAPASPERLLDDGSGQGPVNSTLPLDDPEFRDIVTGFVVRLREQVEAIETAWKCRDMEQLSELAHWLKGAAGTVGFQDYTGPALALMEAARNRQLDVIDRHVRDICSLTSRIQVPATAAPRTAADE